MRPQTRRKPKLKSIRQRAIDAEEANGITVGVEVAVGKVASFVDEDKEGNEDGPLAESPTMNISPPIGLPRRAILSN